MVETAGQFNQPPQEYFTNPTINLVQVVPEMDSDIMIRARAARFIGACATDQYVELSPVEVDAGQEPIESLYDAIQKAAEGNPLAKKVINANAGTDVIERTIKAGHVMEVELDADESGIRQHGQSAEAIQANSLRFAANSWQILERTKPETTNAFRIKAHHSEGTLQTKSFVVMSGAADNMSEEEMTDAGFFTDTMSMAIQVTTGKDSKLTTESAFVAGVKRPGEARHDTTTIVEFGRRLGVDLSGKTMAQIIDTPLLIDNSLMPNGAIDLVRLYDDCAGGTFFGEDKPREDYLGYRQKCRDREQTLQPKVNMIVEELISEAGSIHTPQEATQRLHKISEKHMVEQAAFDDSINPLVFGREAAGHIQQARMQFEMGNHAAGLEQLGWAKETAKSNSCPGAFEDPSRLGDTSNERQNSKDNKDGDCEFISKECPMCHAKNVKTRVTKSRITGSCGCSKKAA